MKVRIARSCINACSLYSRSSGAFDTRGCLMAYICDRMSMRTSGDPTMAYIRVARRCGVRVTSAASRPGRGRRPGSASAPLFLPLSLHPSAPLLPAPAPPPSASPLAVYDPRTTLLPRLGCRRWRCFDKRMLLCYLEKNSLPEYVRSMQECS
jgi:hypothetical protein